MPATGQNITIWAGDSAIVIIAVTDKNEIAVDLAGATARWWMAKSATATGDDNIYIKKDSGVGGGLVIEQISGTWCLVVTLLPTDTEDLARGKFYHEAEVVDVNGNIATVTTGKFEIKPTVIPDIL